MNQPHHLGAAIVCVLISMLAGEAVDFGQGWINRAYAGDIATVVDGVGVFPLDEQTWKSQVMVYPKSVTDKDREWVGPDFFEFEYGSPCDFRQIDLVAKYGFTQKGTLQETNPMPRSTGSDYKIIDGKMVFTVGKTPFILGFGSRNDEAGVPSIRFGGCWGPNIKDRFRLRINLEQDRPTRWVFRVYSLNGQATRSLTKEFTIPQTAAHDFEIDLGFVRKLRPRQAITGISLECATTGATVKIQSMSIAPSSANIYFRKQFYLDDLPVIAHATYQCFPVYDLFINGQKVATGNHMYLSLGTGQQKTIDLLPYLKKGQNTIAFKNEFVFWAPLDQAARWLFEGVAISAQGKITRILGDRTWKCRIGPCPEGAQTNSADNHPPLWAQPNFNESDWLTPRLSRPLALSYMSKTPISDGYNPRYMGCLQVSVHGQSYPLFDVGQNPRFDVQLPIRLNDNIYPIVEVYRAGTDEKVETAMPIRRQVDSGKKLAIYAFKLKAHPVGPYRLIWRLGNKKGKILESRREEMVVVGPIEQEYWTLEDFDTRFDDRLNLIHKIDCSQKFGDSTQYIDHSGMYQPTQTNQSSTITQDGMHYRETGPGTFSYFGYNITFPKLGVPYVIELIIPDNAQRTIYSGIVETHPVRYRNNSRSKGRFAVTSGWLTGGDLPLSNQPKRVRYIHYPAAQDATVLVMNGRKDQARAAAIAINIYEIKGGLPALKIPQTDRLLGSFNERFNLMAETLGCENPMENNDVLMLNEHRDSWYNWYKIIERKVRLLRYQGRNFTTEGLYMYDWGHYASPKHAVGASSPNFDAVRLAFKMYEHNNIRCMIGIEYMCGPEILASGIDNTSDRKMWLGESTIQQVDKYGRQMASHLNSGINFLNPEVRQNFLDLIQDIHERYKDCQSVLGINMVVGSWFLGGFGNTGYSELRPLDVGYGDLTVGLFEHDTNSALNLSSTDPDRFAKRHELLTNQYRGKWINWRQNKIQDFFEQVADIIYPKIGDSDWKLWIYPMFKHQNLDLLPEFRKPALHRDKVTHGMDDFLAETGLAIDRYANNPRVQLITPLVTVGFKSRERGEHELDHLTWNMNPGAQRAIRLLRGVFLNTALDEIDCPAKGWKNFPWTGTRRGVFVPRGVGDLSVGKWLDVSTQSVPRLFITQWMDVNMETGHSEAIRRFARMFYATPFGEFSELSAKQSYGVLAQIIDPPKDIGQYPSGTVCVRLVNNSPYPIAGVLDLPEPSSGKHPVYDLIREQPITKSGGAYSVDLRAYNVRLFSIDRTLLPTLRCRFEYPDNISRLLLSRAKKLTGSGHKLIPRDKAEMLRQACGSKNAFLAYQLLSDFEVMGGQDLATKHQEVFNNQIELLKDLKSKHVAYINCACLQEYVSPEGNRWLPDQSFYNDDAYGQTGANFADRGGLPIQNTNEDKVYQTESYGRNVTYHIPLPNGKYNVGLHLAETFPANNRPGMRRFHLEVQGIRWPEVIDPFKVCNGFAKAHVMWLNRVDVKNRKLVLRFTGQVGIEGIEMRPATDYGSN